MRGGGTMEFMQIIEAIANIGFPAALCVVFGWIVYTMGKRQLSQSEKNMLRIREECKDREEQLMTEIRENRKINAKAIETIAHYAEKLDSIQSDIKEIKQDVSLLMVGGKQS